MKYSFDIMENKEIKIYVENNLDNILKDGSYLKEMRLYFLDAIKSGYFKHHSYRGKYLKIPIRSGRKEMYQLFYLLGFFNNLPSYYFSAIGKSINKKRSFFKI